MRPHPLKEVNYSMKNNKSTLTPATVKIIMRIIIIIVFIIIIILFTGKETMSPSSIHQSENKQKEAVHDESSHVHNFSDSQS